MQLTEVDFPETPESELETKNNEAPMAIKRPVTYSKMVYLKFLSF